MLKLLQKFFQVLLIKKIKLDVSTQTQQVHVASAARVQLTAG